MARSRSYLGLVVVVVIGRRDIMWKEKGGLIDSARGFCVVGFLALSGRALGSVDLNVAPDVGYAIDGKSDDQGELIDK